MCFVDSLTHTYITSLRVPWWLSGKEFTCSVRNAGNAGNTGLTPGLGRPPGEGNGTHSSILCGEFQGQRNLAGYSPWDHKKSDMI